MRQVGLILWKDVRQLRWHLCVYAALLAAFAWFSPQTWPGTTPSSFVPIFVTLLKVLVMASQFVVITSAIQADRLVGEEQFWVTRPYDWQALLAAKCLFVFTCVVMPYVLMQWSLLHVAGLNPFAAKSGMASSYLRFALVPCLPIMLIASVTESLATAFTFLAGLLLAWAGLLQFILSGTELRMSPPYEFQVFGGLSGIVLLAILSYQFARRRTAHARIAFAATVALFLLLFFGYGNQGFGAPVRQLIRSRYEVPSNGSPHLVFVPAPVPYEERGKDLPYLGNSAEVKLPVRLEGLAPDARIREVNVAVTLTANNTHYTTPWEKASVSENAIGFALPKDLFDHLAAAETPLHLELIAEAMRPVRVQHVVAADQFPGPTSGRCLLVKGTVACRFAYATSTPTHVEAFAPSAPCPGQSPSGIAGGWLVEFPPGTRVDPVINQVLPLHENICVGQPLTFTEYGSPHRFRVVLDISAVRLGDYRATN